LSEEYHFTVETTGLRLDKYISDRCPGVSRTRIQKLVEDGQVTVNGRPAKPSFKLSMGDVILVNVPPLRSASLTPEKCRLISFMKMLT